MSLPSNEHTLVRRPQAVASLQRKLSATHMSSLPGCSNSSRSEIQCIQ